MLLGKGACHFGASLTSFSRELPGNFWPGAVMAVTVEEEPVRCVGSRLSLALPAQSRGVGVFGAWVLLLLAGVSRWRSSR